MIDPQDTTLLIQGPLNKISIEHIENYKKYGTILLSYWENDDLDLLKNVNTENVELICNDKVHDSHKIFVDMRVKQWQSTFNGLQNVKTKYVIKLRSDEYYENLSPIIELFEKDTNKMVCSNIFFKQWKHFKFHISDHIMLCKTKIFLKGMTFLFDLLEEDNREILHKSCEMIFATNYLKAVHDSDLTWEYIFSEESKELMRKYFDVIDVNLLGNYHITWNSGEKIFNSEFKYNKENVDFKDLQVFKMDDVFC